MSFATQQGLKTENAVVRRLIRRNWRMACLHTTGKAMYLGNTIMATYYLEKGLNHTDIYGLQVFLYVTSFLVGVPLGRLADKYGNRFLLMLGTVLAVVQSVPFAFAQNFWQFVPSLILLGVQLAAWATSLHTLMDFSITPLSVSRVVPAARKEAATERLHQRVYERYLAAETYAHGVGYVLGVGIGTLLYARWGMHAPFLVQPFLYLGCCGVVMLMKRPPQAQTSEVMGISQTLSVVVKTLQDRKIRVVVWLAVFANSLGLTYFWELQPRMAIAGVDEEQYLWGYLVYGVAITVLAKPCSRLVKRQYLGWAVVVGLNIFGALAAGLTTGWLGVVGLFGIVITSTVLVMRLTSTFLRNALPDERTNRNLEQSGISTLSVVMSAIVGLGFGRCVDVFGLQVSLAWLGVAVAVIGLLLFANFNRAMKR